MSFKGLPLCFKALKKNTIHSVMRFVYAFKLTLSAHLLTWNGITGK
ncbi:hypothetical protein GAGA_3220 [Paraglaciecola agarilytica NO2]|uniref:Transposase n=1 Tax=Paraglaciecola agarilytica NO2 TaxID=1125747 RepID=A0ABQ0I9K0_9ALTE|nr:hypothetical protein GAGA_3220 [Paraglaciecola agarilytica NO2]